MASLRLAVHRDQLARLRVDPAAVPAGDVARGHRVAAAIAVAELGRLDAVMAASFSLASVRDSSLRYGHGSVAFVNFGSVKNFMLGKPRAAVKRRDSPPPLATLQIA